jgi:hypothetical protein
MSGRDVFINCPFTADYQNHFQATVFTVVRSGFTPRCARESYDFLVLRSAEGASRRTLQEAALLGAHWTALRHGG